jgi:CBS domain-containing protein
VPIVDVMPVRLVQVAPDESVHAAAARMAEENVGSVAVCEGSRLVGILTERDVLRLVARGAAADRTRAGEVMTTELVTISPDADVLAAARIMGERRIRHLPIVEGPNLLGIVGIRDVLGALADRLLQAGDREAKETVRGLLERPRR